MEEIDRTVFEGVDIAAISNRKEEKLCELVFERTFTAMRNNDPTVTAFNPISLNVRRAPDRYAQRLGHALLNNTHVQRLQLHVAHFPIFTPLPGDDLEHPLTSLLQYLRTGTALRRVDVEVETGDGEDIDAYTEYVPFVIQALVENLYLETLHLGIEEGVRLDSEFGIQPDVARLLETTTSLQELKMAWTDESTFATTFVANRTLKVLTLYPPIHDENIQGHLFSNYVTQSKVQSLLTKLTISFGYGMNYLRVMEAVSKFIQTAAPSLQILDVSSMEFNDERMKGFTNGIRYHTSLQELHLLNCDYKDGATLHFMKFLNTAPPSLQLLDLSSMTFDDKRMKAFLEGIHCCRSLNELRLSRCQYDNDAASLFATFWQNINMMNLGSGDSNIVTPQQPLYSIKSLYIMEDIHDVTTRMAQVLALSLQKWCLLEHLHWASQADMGRGTALFWNMVSENGHQIRLSSLRLDHHDENGYNAMLQCIPKLQHLRVLHCRPSKYSRYELPSPQMLLNMVRANVSLFQFPDDEDDDDKTRTSIWDLEPVVKQRIHIYFHCNEGLAKLLTCPRAVSSDDGDKDDRHAKRAKKENLVETTARIHLIPLLFAATQPAIYVAPNIILNALLSAVDSIGPIRK